MGWMTLRNGQRVKSEWLEDKLAKQAKVDKPDVTAMMRQGERIYTYGKDDKESDSIRKEIDKLTKQLNEKYGLNYDKKKQSAVSIHEAASKDPLAKTIEETQRRYHDGIKAHYIVKDSLGVLNEAARLLLKRRQLYMNIHSIESDQEPRPITNVPGAYIPTPISRHYILKLSMKAPYSGTADIDMLLKPEDFYLEELDIDDKAGITKNIQGRERVMVRLAFLLFLAYKRAILNETRIDVEPRVLKVRISY